MKKSGFLLILACLVVLHTPSLTFAEEVSVLGTKIDTAKDGDKKKGSEDVSGGRFAGDPIYVHIAPMVLPVINENGVEQIVTIIFDVQVKNFDSADDMHSNMPRVEDALLRALYGGLGNGTLRNGKLADVTKIKSKAVAAVGEVIGTENIQDVLVQGVAQRML